jgi:hypothetical protein
MTHMHSILYLHVYVCVHIHTPAVQSIIYTECNYMYTQMHNLINCHDHDEPVTQY